MADTASHSTGSFELVGAAVLFALVGLGIDRWLGTTPLFALVLAALGFLGAAVSIYYRYRFDMAAIESNGTQR